MPGVIALLPMKAHSERVPGKNFKLLGKKPLFRWILDTLMSVQEIDAVIINTDAKEELYQAGLEESDRVQIRVRREDLCGDLVSMNKIIEDDLSNLDASIYVMTHTTNPFISPQTVSAALKEYESAVESGSADSLFSVNKIQTRFYRVDGSPVNHDPDNLIRTQDLEPWFEENSCLYIFSKQSFTDSGARIGLHPLLFPTPRLESIDIDDPQDWLMAESLVEHCL